MKTLFSLLAALVIAVASTTTAAAQGAKPAEVKRVPVEGKVTVVNEFTRQVTVQTTGVPGMNGKPTAVAFVAKDAAQLAQFKAGDEVKGDLVVSGLDTYLENVTKKDAKK